MRSTIVAASIISTGSVFAFRAERRVFRAIDTTPATTTTAGKSTSCTAMKRSARWRSTPTARKISPSISSTSMRKRSAADATERCRARSPRNANPTAMKRKTPLT